MSSVRLRRMAALAVSATALLALSGCGTGFDAQTNQQYDTGVGSNERGETVDVLNALFVDNGDGTATFSAALLNKESSTQVLESVTTATDEGAPISTELSGELQLPPQKPVSPGNNADIVISGGFPPGGFVTITFNFTDAAPITISAPVVGRTEMYESVAVTPAAETPSAEEAAAEEVVAE